jgi:hypothetical protein
LVRWVERPYMRAYFLPARIGRQQFKGFIIPLGCWRFFLPEAQVLSLRTIMENRDARSPISSYSQEPFPFAWDH